MFKIRIKRTEYLVLIIRVCKKLVLKDVVAPIGKVGFSLMAAHAPPRNRPRPGVKVGPEARPTKPTGFFKAYQSVEISAHSRLLNQDTVL